MKYVFVLLLSFFIVAPAYATLEEGLVALDEEDYDRAYYEISKAARTGDPEAQYYLGFLYQYGYGIERSIEEAKKWYMKSIDKGFVQAQYQLGTFLLENPSDHFGAFWHVDQRAGVELLRQAAFAGFLDAQLELAEMYETGTHVPKDFVQAYSFLKRASRQMRPGEQRKDTLHHMIDISKEMTLEEVSRAKALSVQKF